MTESWMTAFPCNRAQAEMLTDEHPSLAAFDPAPVLVASEIDEDRNEWRIDVYTQDEPDRRLIETMMALLGRKNRKPPKPERLADEDWVTLSQAGLEPVRAGCFYVHTAKDAPDTMPGVVNFRIDAGQAFGTGHHDTTAGCLLALDRLKRQGRRYATVADIGTGTGLLAFAALHLWPRAFAVASDIDPVSVKVSAENAAINGVPIGFGPGKMVLAVADGTRHPLITETAPYDLVCANILAGPLIALAPSLAAITAEGGQLVLAGLLDKQRDAVVAAYRRVGFRVDEHGPGAQWPVLVLTLRRRQGWRRPRRANGSAGQPPGDFGSW
ncbi:50S ribosomal protein L11 methyltransferase [Sphingomonas lacunae]|uniref:Ribosomal protein L11 methyltransferase n=1 Tax=Sphingomonas lacunae TaxID=2698828 RepID=A0A6M4AW88_9SPHN|nr:50S ribosomal protein L11 methyltransferase [Sphingomonas lacunae]QJQ33398.1 50S ribosomal protein L11 methyltransferase [Sphingomonas lacunae]